MVKNKKSKLSAGKKEKHHTQAVTVMVAVVAIVAVVGVISLLQNSGATGAATGKGGDKPPKEANVLAAKMFSVENNLCLKKPLGAKESYAVFDADLGFDINNFITCNPEDTQGGDPDTFCQDLLGKEAKCQYVKHVLLPEMGVFVQTLPEPGPEGCRDHTDCEDGNECTADICSAAVCSNNPVPDGTPCAINVCIGGVCQ